MNSKMLNLYAKADENFSLSLNIASKKNQHNTSSRMELMLFFRPVFPARFAAHNNSSREHKSSTEL